MSAVDGEVARVDGGPGGSACPPLAGAHAGGRTERTVRAGAHALPGIRPRSGHPPVIPLPTIADDRP